jgi:hypothetical protein
MMRVPQPVQRSKQGTVCELEFSPTGDFSHQHRVGEDRHVTPMLFQCGDGKDDGHVPAQRSDIGPGEILEKHDRRTMADASERPLICDSRAGVSGLSK